MMTVLLDEISKLNPSRVFSHFAKILEIPRDSKKEEQIRDYMAMWAAGRGFAHQVDQIGNIWVRVPATAGLEKVPGTISSPTSTWCA